MADTRDHGHGRRQPGVPLSEFLPGGDADGEESYALSGSGEEQVTVGEYLAGWLAKAPQGPIASDSDAGRQAVLTLEATRESGFLSGSVKQPPPAALHAGLAEELAGQDGSSSYELTDWGRQGIGVIFAVNLAEAEHLPGRGSRLTPSELSGMMQMLLPLVELPEGTEDGVVQLGIDPVPGDPASTAAGFWIQVESGRIIATGTGPPPRR